MKRYHVHGAPPDSPCNVAISVSVDAGSEAEAQEVAWLYCPELEVAEIQCDAPADRPIPKSQGGLGPGGHCLRGFRS